MTAGELDHMTTRGLVLGGGGIAGIGWEIGLLSGWAAAGIDVRATDLVVGTSAGSIVGTLLRVEEDLQALYEQQLAPVADAEPRVQFDGTAMMAAFAGALAGATGQQDARARIGELALRASTVTEGERRAIIESRIGDPEWPVAPLLVTAVDTADGEFVAFDASAGVRLLDAVAASCAVPGVWPPITVGGRRCMDGGMRSVTNADLVTGCQQVLVVAPMAGFPNSPLGPTLEQEIEGVRRNADVQVVLADQAALAAFGTNPLDPMTREPSARAGRAQAAATLDLARSFWG
jgi:NTE family protein